MSQCDKSSISKSVARSTDDSTFGYQQYITNLMRFLRPIGRSSHSAQCSTREDALRSVMSSLPSPGDELTSVSASPLFAA